MSLASDRAHSALLSTLNTWVCNNFVLVMANRCLGHRADVLGTCVQHVRMIRRQDSGGGADNGAKGIVELLSFGFLNGRLERRTCGGFGRI